MIGLILGTSEGKVIVEKLNKYTDDLFISVASSYGATILSSGKFKILNDKPLKKEELKEILLKNNVTKLVDASHPYALEITKNAMEVCDELKINYIRFERKSIIKGYGDVENIIEVESYEELYSILKDIKGTILNTTGSRNIEKILNLHLENRIIHRVLPTLKVLQECEGLKVKVEDIIAMKGPFSKELNLSFIDELNIKVMLLKDSGIKGGTMEKLEAIKERGILGVVIGRKNIKYDVVFDNEEELVQYLIKERGNYNEQ
ncbi:cobalt-precorrin-6A reductase [Clostridium senegalense]|uniref:cobalt-precorrin-6A reductase n=1 Tax=Clostridium senegalense TaxID=1465809 RepID=UPI000289B2AB|nr:cobalt-precorrin-6A reductase [Clostridium senegalense]